MSATRDPTPPTNQPLTPRPTRRYKRQLGVAFVVAIAFLLGLGAWHYKHRVPDAKSGDVPLTDRGLR